MQPANAHKSFLVLFLVAFGIVGTTFVIVLFAKGYRLNLVSQNPQNSSLLKQTGIIAATSLPKSAAVYLNDKLTTTTEDTLNLDPGQYQVKIAKDGYLSWDKTFQVKAQIALQTNANLFRSVPDLQPVTLSGAVNPALSPDQSRLLFAVNSAATPKDNGLYLYENTSSPLSLIKTNPHQLSGNLPGLDWSKASFEISPDSQQAIAYFTNNTYLFNLDQTISLKTIKDIKEPALYQQTKLSWQKISQTLLVNRLNKLPPTLQTLISTDSAEKLVFNNQNDKVLYQAKTSGVLPLLDKNSMPARSTQVESRSLKAGNYYVYDLIDDTNFLIGDSKTISQIYWIPQTDNLIYTQNQNIYALDYDATNQQKLYAGNFNPGLLLPDFDGKKIIVLTSPYQGASENLYAITIR